MRKDSTPQLEEMIPIVKACQLAGLTVGTIRNQIYMGTPTPFPVYKHPHSGKLVALASEAMSYRQRLLTQCRVDVGRRAEKEAQ